MALKRSGGHQATVGEQTFAHFMDSALYGPGGYYSEHVSIGRRGADFYTASSLPLFAKTLVRWAAGVWRRWGKPAALQIVELGPGEGDFAASFCEAWREQEVRECQLRYVLAEVSPILRRRQQQRLSAQISVAHIPAVMEVVWDDIRSDWPTLIIANEVLDALPVERVRRTEEGWEQAWVVLDKRHGTSRLEWRTADSHVARLANEYVDCPVNGEAEVAPALVDFFSSLRSWAIPITGVFFDYGITREEWQAGARPFGTLRGYRRHRVYGITEILDQAGMVDITADVNWSHACAAAEQAGFTVLPLCSQAHFLMEHGILQVAEGLAPRVSWSKLAAQIKQLTLPDGMGERFSVLEIRTEE
ncbi:MAG: SAM-dependent methyltransferase [Alicyclobacillus herbarius]|uniref:class I SAM-dependent methyltransferase n=1 Tax=Alicyclobacillus herbarius TaxID=122960 RepID=UPI0023557173|nr:SAM-dependent methyltransferase [Alicyclobacillus herbarius]MCL6631714.1 SAM-dependent methyltransferase [Alicyclobacillus herbarius]